MSYEVPWQPVEASSEEDIIRSAAELPIIPQERTGRILEVAARAYRRHRLLHHVQNMTLAFVCLSFAGLLGTYYISLFRVGTGSSSIVIEDRSASGLNESSKHGTLSVAQMEFQKQSENIDARVVGPARSLSADEARMGPIARAAASSDNWALVDAFATVQNSKSDLIRKILWH